MIPWKTREGPRPGSLEGESLFYPWRVRSPVRHARRIDGVLATSIRQLASGEDEEGVLWAAHQVGEAGFAAAAMAAVWLGTWYGGRSAR